MTLHERYDRLLDKLVAEVKVHYGPDLVSCVVFGSVGRGTPREDSDVDLLIVAERLPRGRMQRSDHFLPVEEKLTPQLAGFGGETGTVALSPIFKTPAEVRFGSPIFLDMVDDSKILYDRDGFFDAYLTQLRRRLERLGARRIWRGNGWHWLLKPDLKPGEVFEI